MSAPIIECGFPVNVTATGNVNGSSTTVDGCKLLGFYVNSTSSGTLVLRRGGSGGTVISGTITPAAGTFHRFPADISGLLHVTVGGTIDTTFFITY
jgi:hypothetical protein